MKNDCVGKVSIEILTLACMAVLYLITEINEHGLVHCVYIRIGGCTFPVHKDCGFIVWVPMM